MSDHVARWSDLKLRLASAIALIVIAGTCLWQGSTLYNCFILLAMVGLVWEGETLVGQPLRTWRGFLLLAWPIIAALIALHGQWVEALGLIVPAFIFGSMASLPIIVAIIGGISLLWLRHLEEGLESVLFVLCVVIASDSFAYVTGRIFGGAKLAPSISPGKTRSGAIGGLIGAACAGAMVAFFSKGSFIVGGLLWGGILGVFSQSGDLVESAVKRRLGVKDSGYIIPGHGGLLDRFDGLLAAAPVAALLSLLATGQVFWSVNPIDLVGGSSHHTISQGDSLHG